MAMQDWKSVYSRIFWKNKREGGTPLNEANLNTSDIALKEIDNRILELRDAKLELEEQILDLQTMIVTGDYYTQIIDTDNQNILVDDNYVLRADWKGVTT